MLVADRQGGILKPCIPLQDAQGGGAWEGWAGVWWGRNFSCGGGGGGIGSWCGEKGQLLGRIGRDESCSGMSWLLAKR